MSNSEHIYDTSLYVQMNINDIKQHYPALPVEGIY